MKKYSVKKTTQNLQEKDLVIDMSNKDVDMTQDLLIKLIPGFKEKTPSITLFIKKYLFFSENKMKEIYAKTLDQVKLNDIRKIVVEQMILYVSRDDSVMSDENSNLVPVSEYVKYFLINRLNCKYETDELKEEQYQNTLPQFIESMMSLHLENITQKKLSKDNSEQFPKYYDEYVTEEESKIFQNNLPKFTTSLILDELRKELNQLSTENKEANKHPKSNIDPALLSLIKYLTKQEEFIDINSDKKKKDNKPINILSNESEESGQEELIEEEKEMQQKVIQKPLLQNNKKTIGINFSEIFPKIKIVEQKLLLRKINELQKKQDQNIEFHEARSGKSCCVLI